MSMRRSLWIILVIGLMGMAFSGALTVREYTARAGGCSPLGASGTILGYPPCVYGLVMYLVVVIVAGLGLRKGS
ncbi:MAG TPA: hypothetical protein VG940_11830 [Gemmatimonadales bacterium]|nr:hypothetical protein [Gemmatimonadales bacterium]